MSTQGGKIGTVALKAANLFEKELCESMKQTFISDFFEKKLLFDTAILCRILYVLIDSKYEMWMRFLKCFFYSLVKSDVFKDPIYLELRLTRTFVKSDTFSIPLEGPS